MSEEEQELIKNCKRWIDEEDISNMYDEEYIISILCDNFDMTRYEVLQLLGGE